MTLHCPARATLLLCACLSLAACGGGRGGGGLFGGIFNWGSPNQAPAAQAVSALPNLEEQAENQSTLWDLFGNRDDANVTVNVNKYLWNASLDILNFLPVESVDPFTGVIVTGFGTPPGGGRAYRATILIQDPALDARSLNVALQTRGGGPVSAETTRAIEDAILTRARQLRIRDSNL
jgi:hypothetical protein